MSIFNQLGRLNPLRILRSVESVPRLHDLGERVRSDQKDLSRQLRELSRQIERLDETIRRHERALADLPVLQSTLDECRADAERCTVAYQKDAAFAEIASAVRETLDPVRVPTHAAAAVAAAPLFLDPCPHIVIDGLLPDTVRDELVRALPPPVFFAGRNPTRRELSVPLKFAPEHCRTVWGFFYREVLERAILPAVVEKFRPAIDALIDRHWPTLQSLRASGITLGVTNSRLMLHRPGYCIKPHRDPRWAFLTCLVYLQGPDARHAYGTQFYRLHEEQEPSHHSPLWLRDEQCILVKDVPARRNAAVVFLNSTGAHGASVPEDAPADLERYIYQVQFGPGPEAKQMLIEGLDGDARRAWATARSKY